MGTLYCQMSHGVSELVHTHYTALATAKHWLVVFTLLEFAVSSGSTPSPSDQRPVSPSTSSRDESCDTNQQPDWSTRSVRSELLWRPEVDPMHFEVVNFDNCFDPVDGLPLPVHEPQVSGSVLYYSSLIHFYVSFVLLIIIFPFLLFFPFPFFFSILLSPSYSAYTSCFSFTIVPFISPSSSLPSTSPIPFLPIFPSLH